MGVEFHITRAEFWSQNDACPITEEEWLEYVASDPELRLDRQRGKHFAVWLGKSKHDDPWLCWFDGNIDTKWPDTALYKKMLSIASSLNAVVQDDEGTLYSKEDDWDFDPTLKR